jgi:cellulose synthase/poly-beta-1,6-N-acetylglucosamine synthase-like glycosyltransferase
MFTPRRPAGKTLSGGSVCSGPASPGSTVPLTVIIPAFNEAASIADTLRSLLSQTRIPEEVIVVDDCSTDGTGDVARGFGATVLRPPANTGSKAGAQTFALDRVRTPYTIALDADTMLAPDAVERLLPAFEDPRLAAACGSVLPRRVRSVWERGRYIEYLFAFTFYKRVQDQYGAPLISSGCFSMYRTAALRAVGGWRNRTLAEDVDLTWTLYQQGYAVRFVPEALAYPIEPRGFGFLKKQLRRWSHGFVQNIRLHRRGLLAIPFLRSAVAVSLWDAVIASLVYLLLLPAAAIWFHNPLILLGYLIDVPAILVPVLVGAWPRREVGRALLSVPCFFILRTVNALFFLGALWSETVRGRSFLVYEKGH